MIRRLTLVGASLLAVVAAAVAIGAKGPGPNPYRVNAIFDNADFLVAGQDVKIAGAVEGRVAAVRLTPQRKALVEMEVRREFGPFRSDASCSIRPESLIGEKFVDCDPGTPRGKPIRVAAGGTPTVPLERNHSPVDLDLVFAALRLPYRERLTVLLNELGTGLAGRPAELNAAIRRANPAIQRANDVLAILDRDRHTLGRLIDSSDRVLAELAARRGDVRDFIGRADRVAAAVASRRGDLGLAIDRLPPLLAQLQPAANDLAGLAGDARPVANDLRVAATPVRRLLGDLGPLTDAARPTLVALNELSRTGRRAIRSTNPVAKLLLPVAKRLPEVARLSGELNVSLRENGVPEALGAFVYLGTAATARFDRFSHILPSYQITGTCQQYATAPVAGCSAKWGAGQTADGRRQKRKAGRSRHVADRRRPRSAPRRPDRRPPAQPPSAQLPSSHASPPASAPPATPGAPQLPDPAHILDFLLGP